MRPGPSSGPGRSGDGRTVAAFAALPAGAVGRQSQPFSRAMRMASMRLCPPTLLMALDR